MEALLASAAKKDTGFSSVAELVDQLRSLLAKKVTPGRSEHVSTTFELRSSVVFHVPVTDADGLENIDPLLSGTRPADGVQGTRQINARETVLNQPQDDPVLQKSVARHLIAAIGETDGSNWIARSVSKVAHGWTFLYICKDSCQAWSRQVAKNPAKTIVMEWSNKDGQDPVNLGRPAFDCRGSVEIAFNRSSRSIILKYEHSPIHKTVAQLLELLAPPPAAMPEVPTPVKARKQKEPKEPKAPKPPKAPRPPREPKTPGSGKRKRRVAEDNQEGNTEAGSPKQKKRKKNSNAPIAPVADMIPPEMSGALPVNNSSVWQPYNTQDGGPTPNGGGTYPQGLVGSAAEEAIASGVHVHSIPNLPPEETERRRQAAIKLLSDSGIDPQTLSMDQFAIFANQSPELQHESLAMLVKYGAERLRIVHPPEKDGTASTNSTPGPPQPPSVSPAPAINAVQTPPKKSPKGRTKKASETGSDSSPVAPATAPSSKKTPKPVACENCRRRRIKCAKQVPACEACVAVGKPCYYPPRKKRASRARVDESEAEAEPEAQLQLQAPPTVQEVLGDEPDDLGSPGFHYGDSAAMSQSESAYPPPEPVMAYHQQQQSSGAYQSHSELSHSHGAASDFAPTSLDYSTGGASIAYPHLQPTQPTALTFPDTLNPVQASQRVSKPPQPKPRRSLPSAAANVPAAAANGGIAQVNNNDWQGQAVTSPVVAASTTKALANMSRSRMSAPVPAYNKQQALDGIQQTKGLSEANLQAEGTSPPVQYPGLAVAQTSRAKSRQRQRAQTLTPVRDGITRQRQSPAAHPASTAPSPSLPNYDSYSQYSATSRTAEPYSNNPSSNTASNYTSYTNYSNERSNKPEGLPNPVSQPMQTSYDSSSSQTANRWASNSTSTSGSQPHDRTHAHRAAPGSTIPTGSLHKSSQQSEALVRNMHQPSAQSRTSSNSYGQQTKQHDTQYQPQLQQQQQQQQSYNSQPSRAQRPANTQQTQQQQQQQQQGWFGFPGNNTPSSGYAGAGARGGAASHSSGSYGQHHLAMNPTGHEYTTMNGDQALYNMLHNNNQGP